MGIKPVLVEGESLERSSDTILTREGRKRVFKPVTQERDQTELSEKKPVSLKHNLA